ncbi:MAG: SBBP repeat-containing protein [Acidobacteriia bacterium]|nr:SBBP repeat-containing protein [Terriglobia bacterium]
MSKPSAPKTLIPAVWTVVVVVMGIAALAAAGHAGLRGPSAAGIAEAISPRPWVAPGLSTEQSGAVRSDQVRASMSTLPLAFEANQGQTDSRVKYVARGSGYTLFLTAEDAVMALHSSSQVATAKKDRAAGIYMHLVGGNPGAQIAGDGELPGTTNYFVGRDRSHWQRGVKQYAAVRYRDVYPGVNLAFHGGQRQLEFDFVVAPGAEASRIAMRFSGARKISADVTGKLTLATDAGNVTLLPPEAFQERDGVRQSVAARFVLKGDNQVSFALGDYDRGRELVIDPSVSYATYLGGTAEDDGYSIAIDSSGNAYVTGQTKSTNFPTVAGSHSTANAGSFDVFVTKISADGSTLLYSTYVGGSSDDRGTAIALDASGYAFVAGSTSSNNFSTTSGALQTTYEAGRICLLYGTRSQMEHGGDGSI